MSVCRESLCRGPVRAAALTSAFVLAIIGISCGGADSPSTPSTPPTTVSPQPTPTPPTGGGGGVTASCPIGQGDENATCSRTKTKLLPYLESAMDLLIQQKPQIFDLNDEYAEGTRAYKVLDHEGYINGLVANLQAAGLCAQFDVDDPNQETILAKSENDFSESFDVLLSTGHMRRGGGMYRDTCTPSSFPVDRPADAPPIGSGCYRPYPPPVSRFNCKVHLKGADFYTLDSTPIVGPNLEYCNLIGFSGRTLCPVRPEGAPDRAACENWRVGIAKDTGRPGPTWTKEDGSFCTGPESGCANSPDGQYQLWAYLGGTYRVAAENGADCTVDVYR
jgi:hypothetical protein